MDFNAIAHCRLRFGGLHCARGFGGGPKEVPLEPQGRRGSGVCKVEKCLPLGRCVQLLAKRFKIIQTLVKCYCTYTRESTWIWVIYESYMSHMSMNRQQGNSHPYSSQFCWLYALCVGHVPILSLLGYHQHHHTASSLTHGYFCLFFLNHAQANSRSLAIWHSNEEWPYPLVNRAYSLVIFHCLECKR